jgi:O-antigen/teichoic acid export membrane protein
MRALEWLHNVLPRNDFFRAALTIAAGTGAAQLITLVSAPVLTRLYSPADYGVFSVATSMLTVLISVTCLRYDYAIPLPQHDATAVDLLALSLLVNLIMSLATGIVVSVVGASLLGLFGASVLTPYVLLFALWQLGGGITSTFISGAVRAKDFSGIALNRLTQSGSLTAVQIALGVVGFGAPGLLLGAVVGSIAGSTRLARAAWSAHADAFRRLSWAGILTVAERYIRFPIFSSASALLGALGVRAPLLLLVASYGTEVGGQYALAERLCYLPLTLVAGGVGQVFIAEGARLAHDQPGELRRLFWRTTWSLARLAIVPAVIVIIAAPYLAAPVFGDSWREAGIFVAILVPMFCLAFVVTSTGDVLYVLERQELHLLREILRLALLGGSVLIATSMHLSPAVTVAVLSAAGCLTYVLYGVVSWRAIVTYRPQALPSFGASPDAIRDSQEVQW